MTQIKIGVLMVAVLMTAGCSHTFPISGSSDSAERFTGSGTAALSGYTLEITSNTGTICEGTYAISGATGGMNGVGVAQCSDGRVADIVFFTDGQSGSGYGKLSDGSLAQFVFGEGRADKNYSWAVAERFFDQLAQETADQLYYCEEVPGTPRCAAQP